jgi:nitrite reductase/ring-hydroxylating ferredoxin subunit
MTSHDIRADRADPARRTVLRGVLALGAAGLTVPALAACGGGDDAAASDGPPAAAPAGTVVGATADIPVGGGAIYPAVALVVTQPKKGTFKAFSTRCPHTGCPVDKVAGEKIVCPCHGSQFSIKDGSVLKPPAPKPLTERAINVSGGQITIA